MFALFMDEFGHERPYDPAPDPTTYNPVFGYGGIAVPARNLAAFATHFFDLKTFAMRNMLLNKQISPTKANGKQDARFADIAHLKALPNNKAILEDQRVRRLCAKYEVKGDEIFSRQYLIKQRGIIRDATKLGQLSEAARARRKIRGFFNFMRAFLKLLSEHGAQPIYFGVDKRRYHAQDFAAPHLKFVPEIVQMAFDLAQRHNTTAALYIDRHHTDGREDASGSAARQSGWKGRVNQDEKRPLGL